MSSNWQSGSTSAWRRLRAAILARDHYRCRAHTEGWCNKPGVKPHTCTIKAHLGGPHAGHAHHTLGKAITGDNPAHIIAACRACNLAIGDPTQGGDPPGRSATQW